MTAASLSSRCGLEAEWCGTLKIVVAETDGLVEHSISLRGVNSNDGKGFTKYCSVF